MSQLFHIHPENPQPRLVNQAVDYLNKGSVIVYPTDSGYALGCRLEEKNAMEQKMPEGEVDAESGDSESSQDVPKV